MCATRARRMRHFLSRVVPDQAIPGDDDLVDKYERYLATYVGGWRLYADTLDCLDRLRPKFCVGILTNGAAAMQRRKVEHTGLSTRIDLMVVSEEIGYAKPAPEAFIIACDRLSITPDRVLYVGDDPRIDIDGAMSAGLRAALISRTAVTGEAALEELTSRLLIQ